MTNTIQQRIAIANDTKTVTKPHDPITVHRWQLDRLLDGLAQIAKSLDDINLGDRISVAGGVGFASGSATALAMLVESMAKGGR